MTKTINLTQDKDTIVDDEDYDKIKEMKWYTWAEQGYFYACHSESKNKKIRLHRFILGLKEGELCDHINGNGLDNRRSNLRIVTTSQNLMNSRKPRNRVPYGSLFKGVAWNKQLSKWQVQISGKHFGQKYLGLFSDEIEAAKAYDHTAEQLFGEYARLNFPNSEDQFGGEN